MLLPNSLNWFQTYCWRRFKIEPHLLGNWKQIHKVEVMLHTLISWTEWCPLHCIRSLYATYLHVWLPPHGGQGTRSDSRAPTASHRHMSARVLPLSQWQLFYAVSGNLICLHGVSRSSLGLEVAIVKPNFLTLPENREYIVFHIMEKWVSSQTKH